ncbi:hypothetical protein BGM09_10280 [Streptomyces sp. CBMA29]|nr:hypothetical protein [Streptomyces sp. CBMA29]
MIEQVLDRQSQTPDISEIADVLPASGFFDQPECAPCQSRAHRRMNLLGQDQKLSEHTGQPRRH